MVHQVRFNEFHNNIEYSDIYVFVYIMYAMYTHAYILLLFIIWRLEFSFIFFVCFQRPKSKSNTSKIYYVLHGPVYFLEIFQIVYL